MRKAVSIAALLALAPAFALGQLLMTGVGGPFTGAGGGSPIGWDSVNSAAGMTISGTNKTVATTSGSNGVWRSAISATQLCNGNYYAEVTATSFDASSGMIIGIAGASPNVNKQPVIGSDPVFQSAGWQQGSPTFGATFSLTSATQLAYTSGDVLSLAVRTSGGRVWLRKNGGAWAGGGDPAANTTPSGILVPGTNAGVLVLFSGGNFAGTADVATINAGPSMAQTVPSGFTIWNSGTTCSVVATTNGWNSGISSVNFTFSGTNSDTATGATTTSAWRSAKSVSSHSSGKFFVEHFTIARDSSNGIILGFGNSTASTASYAGSDGNSIGCQSQGSGQGGMSSCPTWQLGDILDFEIDTTAKKVWIRKNGAAWQGGGDPEAGTTPSGTYTTTGAMFSMFSAFNAGPDTDRVYTGTTPVYAPTASYSVWN